MKPKIVTRLANIAAKLAGSDKYDPTVKPVTPLEYYMNEIPVTPKPTDRDAGKNLVVGDNGAYELQTPTTPVEVPQPAVADAGKYLGVDGNGAYELQAIVTPVDVPQPTVADSGKFLGVNENGAYALTETGTEELTAMFSSAGGACSMTPQQVLTALGAGKTVNAVYKTIYGGNSNGTFEWSIRNTNTYVHAIFLQKDLNNTSSGAAQLSCLRFSGNISAGTWTYNAFVIVPEQSS